MSASTYFKMTTRTTHNRPIAELEYILFGRWDVWGTHTIKSEDVNLSTGSSVRGNDKLDIKSHWHLHSIFKVWIYELDESESVQIISDIEKKAVELGIYLKVDVISSSLSDDEILAIS